MIVRILSICLAAIGGLLVAQAQDGPLRIEILKVFIEPSLCRLPKLFSPKAVTQGSMAVRFGACRCPRSCCSGLFAKLPPALLSRR